jgi:hypothetical protein
MNLGRKVGLAAVITGVVGTGVAFARGQEEKPKSQPPPAGSVMAKMQGLSEALKKTPGCLGVEGARTMSGKQVIFAWFENKKAVLNWYGSPLHQDLMKSLGPPSHPPLHAVKDEKTPIMVIASLTMDNRPHVDNARLPVKQISIEMYAPLPGGAALNGKFAPDSLKVKEMTLLHENK